MPRLLFATDLDKTLLDDRAEVPQACLEAIRRYVEQGGAFTVATGRPTRGVLIYPELMALVNLPIITYNGACIYDTVAKRTVWRRLLPESFAPLVREVLERFPRTGALVFHREDDETCVIPRSVHLRRSPGSGSIMMPRSGTWMILAAMEQGGHRRPP